MSGLRRLWLVLTILGALPGLMRALIWLRGGAAPLAVWPAGGLAGPGSDLAATALALTCFALAETYVRKNWEALWAVPAAWLIGPGCGLPLYLYLRARPVR